MVPVLFEFKQNNIAQLPSPIGADQAPEAATFVQSSERPKPKPKPKPEPKEEPTPSSGNLDVDWNNLCVEILMGKAKEVDLKRITKEMLDAGRQKEMSKEFIRIGKLLGGN